MRLLAFQTCAPHKVVPCIKSLCFEGFLGFCLIALGFVLFQIFLGGWVVFTVGVLNCTKVFVNNGSPDRSPKNTT